MSVDRSLSEITCPALITIWKIKSALAELEAQLNNLNPDILGTFQRLSFPTSAPSVATATDITQTYGIKSGDAFRSRNYYEKVAHSPDCKSSLSYKENEDPLGNVLSIRPNSSDQKTDGFIRNVVEYTETNEYHKTHTEYSSFSQGHPKNSDYREPSNKDDVDNYPASSVLVG